jgi:hypothetical protein
MPKNFYKIVYAYNVSQRSSVTSQYVFHIYYFRYISRADQVNTHFLLRPQRLRRKTYYLNSIIFLPQTAWWQTCEPPARETKSTAFKTLSRPPEKIKISRLFKI